MADSGWEVPEVVVAESTVLFCTSNTSHPNMCKQLDVEGNDMYWTHNVSFHHIQMVNSSKVVHFLEYRNLFLLCMFESMESSNAKM